MRQLMPSSEEARMKKRSTNTLAPDDYEEEERRLQIQKNMPAIRLLESWLEEGRLSDRPLFP